MAQRLKDLPIGALVKDTTTLTAYGQPIIWKVVAKNHEGYPENSVTLISDKVIYYNQFDGPEVNNPLLGPGGVEYSGWARYDVSNIRQWLNSDAAANEWYAPQHEYDGPPTQGDIATPGFLNSCSKTFKEYLLDTEIKTYVNSSQQVETIIDKIFLPSFTELGYNTYNGVGGEEGKKWEYFSDNLSRQAYPASREMLIYEGWWNETNIANLLAKPVSYWVRSARLNTESSQWAIDGSGSTDGSYNANMEHFVRPACNVKADLYATSVPDSDGAYILSPRKKMYIYRVDLGIYLYSSIDEILLDKDGMYLLAADEQ